MPRINTQIHGDLDRLVELGIGPFFHELHRFGERIGLAALDPLAVFLNPFSNLRHRTTPPPRGPSTGRIRRFPWLPRRYPWHSARPFSFPQSPGTAPWSLGRPARRGPAPSSPR